ncbi:MAG: VOC family protein [Alphaproteobacteria bacterium]|nr:VOC family protein [Alphaproteobacteria bacterium]
MSKPQRISTCLWYDRSGEEAATLYTSLFDNSRITSVSRYSKGAPLPEGTALLVEFTLDGVPFQALNGGPMFKLSEAASLSVRCDTQTEIDRLWNALIAGGGAESRCGWLKDRFGLSWQIVPSMMATWMTDPARAARVMAVFMPMNKLDIATLEAAYRG